MPAFIPPPPLRPVRWLRTPVQPPRPRPPQLRQPRPAPPPSASLNPPLWMNAAKRQASPSTSATMNAHSFAAARPLPASPFPPISVPAFLKWKPCAPRSKKPLLNCAPPPNPNRRNVPSSPSTLLLKAARRRSGHDYWQASSPAPSAAPWPGLLTAAHASPTPDAALLDPPYSTSSTRHFKYSVSGKLSTTG